MKKVVSLILIALMITTSLSFNVSAAVNENKTIGQLKKDLAEYKRKASLNENQKKLTKSEINQKNQAITNAYNEQKNNEQKVEEAKIKVQESEEKVKEVTEETNDLIRFFQISSGENVYLSYLANSNSITDFIMRASVTEQLSAYNSERLDNLEELINENKKLQDDLAKRNIALDSSIDSYKNTIDSLSMYLNQLDEFSISVEEDIKATEQTIKNYTAFGCKDNETIAQCISKYRDSTMLRPLNKGRVTSIFGPRGSGLHNAVDIGGNPEGTPIYSVAGGVVALVTRFSCGGNTVFINHTIGGKPYTSTYAHLLNVNVRAGQVVTSQTQIGTVGGYSTAVRYGGYDRCTFGAHLHYVVANGYWTNWNNFQRNLRMPPNIVNRVGWTFNTRI